MKEEFELKIYCDGGARGNPGPAAYGFVIFDKQGLKIYGQGKTIGVSTNNVAEYSSVAAALKYVLEHKIINHKPASPAGGSAIINFYLDSMLVAQQLSGRWKIKNENLRNLYFTIKELEDKIEGKISYAHIVREQNTEADKLVNLALDGKI